MWFHPGNLNDTNESKAAMQATDFWNSWFLNPIFSKKGGYSKIMKDRISMHSSVQGFRSSRLPSFTNEQIDLIKSSSDYLAINFYRSLRYIEWPDKDIKSTISFFADIGAKVSFDTEDDSLKHYGQLCSIRVSKSITYCAKINQSILDVQSLIKSSLFTIRSINCIIKINF